MYYLVKQLKSTWNTFSVHIPGFIVQDLLVIPKQNKIFVNFFMADVTNPSFYFLLSLIETPLISSIKFLMDKIMQK